MATASKNALGGSGTLVNLSDRANPGDVVTNFDTAIDPSTLILKTDDTMCWLGFPHTNETRLIHTDPDYGKDMKIGAFRRLFSHMVDFVPRKRADGTQPPRVRAPLSIQLPIGSDGLRRHFKLGNGILKLRMEATIVNPDPNTEWDDDGNLVTNGPTPGLTQTPETTTDGKNAADVI